MVAEVSLWRGAQREACVTGEMPDAIGWNAMPFRAGREQSVARGFSRRSRQAVSAKAGTGVGCERYYLAPIGLIRTEELPAGWGLLEVCGRDIER